MSNNILVAANREEWASLAADKILESLLNSLTQRGEASLVLSGGSTPKAVYQKIASRKVDLDWNQVFIFWSDERCVPPEHPDSNYNMAKASLLDHLAIPAQNVFRMIGDIEPKAGAQDYEEMISAYFYNREKRFDLALLGLGEDGHTASLFPGTPALTETIRWAIENPHPYSDSTRLTLTYPALNASRQIFFLVTGSGKAQVVKEVVQEPNLRPPHPAKKVIGIDSPPLWLLDAEAATEL